MIARKAGAAMAAVAVVISIAGCGGDGGGKSTLDRIRQAGKITVGVKADQPLVGSRNPYTGKFEGFDLEMAKIVATALGLDPRKDIVFKEVVSKNREAFIKNGTVDIVIASYSINVDRRKQVSQAGPYYTTGQQLLVREEDKNKISGPDKLKGVRTCSAVGSTTIKKIETRRAVPVPFSSYAECVQLLLSGSIDAVTTDGAILAGYAKEQPDELEVVGSPFSEEEYGIGFEYGDARFCDFLRQTIQRSFQDGSWRKAFEATLGRSEIEVPSVPAVDENCWEKREGKGQRADHPAVRRSEASR